MQAGRHAFLTAGHVSEVSEVADACTTRPFYRSVSQQHDPATRPTHAPRSVLGSSSTRCADVYVLFLLLAAVFDILCQRENAVHIKSTTLLVKQYWITNSIIATQRAYLREFGVRNPPKRNTILGLVNKLETTGSLSVRGISASFSQSSGTVYSRPAQGLRSPSLLTAHERNADISCALYKGGLEEGMISYKIYTKGSTVTSAYEMNSRSTTFEIAHQVAIIGFRRVDWRSCHAGHASSAAVYARRGEHLPSRDHVIPTSARSGAGCSTESYPAFARIELRENPGKNLNQVTCPNRNSNPGHLVSQPDALTVTPQAEDSPWTIRLLSRGWGKPRKKPFNVTKWGIQLKSERSSGSAGQRVCRLSYIDGSTKNIDIAFLGRMEIRFSRPEFWTESGHGRRYGQVSGA
ncbi:hypothetical protein ANN_22901 [Periplaneta americana]|uniref:DUF4817 domain-containing protein n=1 Tax=Periplaneta americana TaxID=6978 RepID=A0ABQ8SKT2_PERAM|nr:hypothetical protein ANN_22901 [Periplaneta americana]